MTISQIIGRVAKIAADNSPLILTSIGVAGTLGTAVLTGKACWQANNVLRDYLERPGYIPQDRRELSFRVIVRETWPLFIPPLATAAVTVTSIIMANKIGTRRAAALAAAYSISEKAFEEYRDKVVERIGKKDEREVREEIAQDRIDKNPQPAAVLIANEGDVPCYDQYSSRYFFSTKQKIDAAVNEINYHITHHGYASLNDFYSKIELEITKFGEELGWTSMALMDVTYTSVVGHNDRPTLVINFPFEPIRDYHRVH